MTRIIAFAACFLCTMPAFSQLVGPDYAPETLLLWDQQAPGETTAENPIQPRLHIFLPDAAKRTGTGVVVLPGGGYVNLAMQHEGKDIATWLNHQGIAAFVLEYRRGPAYQHPIPSLDARRALRFVRFHAERFGIDPDRLGIWGFSAGGHLASTTGTHIEHQHPTPADPIDEQSGRPSFMILGYPVISLNQPYTHQGSRRNLLGNDADEALVASLSNETQVTAETPPTFLFHTTADRAVPPENSVVFYLALREAGVDAEMHIYQDGHHGVGLAPLDPILYTWADRLSDWFTTRGL